MEELIQLHTSLFTIEIYKWIICTELQRLMKKNFLKKREPTSKPNTKNCKITFLSEVGGFVFYFIDYGHRLPKEKLFYSFFFVFGFEVGSFFFKMFLFFPF